MSRWRGVKVENFGIRLVALFLALILWVVATERPQRNLGLDQRRVTLELAFANLSDDLEISQMPRTVDVTLEGPRLILPFQSQDASAAVDLNDLGPGAHRVPVQVELPTGISLKDVQPRDVSVRLEARASRSVPVYVAVQGVPAGVSVSVTRVVPETLQVIGALSAVDRVAHILARAPYGVDHARTPVVPVDIHGLEVVGVFVSESFVDVTLLIQGDPADVPLADDPPEDESTQ